jgi:hypothetical protein
MAYNTFTVEKLSEKLNLSQEFKSFIPTQLPSFSASDFLLQTLADAENEALGTEKAKSELIITPMIKELKRHNHNAFSYFSGYKFDVDKKLDLKGFCDFIFSALPNRVKIETPVFLLVEAKNDNLESGWGQCGAEMLAAQLFNQQHHNPQPVIYGCVTNAFTWCFLKLEQQNLYIDPHYLPLTFTQPHQVLAALQWVFEHCLQNQETI